MGKVFHKLLCPIEFERQSMAVLEIARRLAEENGATVCLVHAVTAPLPRPLEPVPEWERTANGKLGEIAQARFGDQVRWATAILHGDPAAAIIRAAGDLDADLIVMATHGHSLVNRILLGSVTERVVRESPIPVLTVCPEPAAN